MRTTEDRLRRVIKDIVVEHSSIASGSEAMLASGYGSKIYGSAEKYFTLRIELDGNVEAKWALEGIDLNKGEVVSHEENTIIAKFPYTITGNRGKKQQGPAFVAENLAFWIGR